MFTSHINPMAYTLDDLNLASVSRTITSDDSLYLKKREPQKYIWRTDDDDLKDSLVRNVFGRVAFTRVTE